MEDALKLTVIPVGGFADRETVPLNPFTDERAIVVDAVDPCCRVRLDGLMLSEKSGWAVVEEMVMLVAVLVLPV